MKKTILLTLAVAAGFLTMVGAARRNNGKLGGFNFLPVLAIVCIAAILTACGGGGNSASATPTTVTASPTHEQIALVDQQVGTTGVTREELFRILLENNIAQRDYFEQRLRELGLILPTTIRINATVVAVDGIRMTLLPAASLRIYPLMTITSLLTTFGTMTITLGISGMSYTPKMAHVVHAAMADGFNSGVAIGESGFAFSGRYDGDNRAAGFTYHLDEFALRTDYIRLPSKQDSEVWLDTYRFGVLRPINDEARFFAGVDSYRNAIFAIDTNGDSQHRFGVAIGDGYATRYEYRMRL